MNMRIFFNTKTLLMISTLFLFALEIKADLVGFTLTSNGNATSGEIINYPDMNRTITSTGLNSSGYSSVNGHTTWGWNAPGSDGWVTSTISTESYISISGSFQMKASNTGPRDFKVQYSLNGSNWYDATMRTSGVIVTQYQITNSFDPQYTFNLPVTCENKTAVQIRWIQNSSTAVDGSTVTSTSTKNASLKGVSIQANPFIAPSTQASNISIISVTPTTIRIGCTVGNGNNRIIKINTTNNFTDPVDDSYPEANSVYSGSGEQVIYNGTNSSMTVTVSNATDIYWFRVYEFNKMDDLTRFINGSASYNPKECRLETIHAPSYTEIKLIRATLGATINTPTTGSIEERGIFWSTTSPVDETSNIISESSSEGGVFKIPDIFVARGTTIYFKGYVTNEYGTILSEESSFSNIPVFTGTGNWETPDRWNVQEVPGLYGDENYSSVEDSPVINGNCTLTSSNQVNNLTINTGRNLTIKPEVLMQVDGTLTNNAGVGGILVKANSAEANGSLIFANGNPSGSVEMYSKAYWIAGNPVNEIFKWQFFGVPVKSTTVGSTFTGYYHVRKWDETILGYENIWGQPLGSATVMNSFDGYEHVQPANKTYIFKGELENRNLSRSLSYTSDAYFAGQHILANPYTAAMPVSAINFGANTESAVYLYNTGTYMDWLNAGGENTPGSGPGTYTVSTPETAGDLGIPSQIPSMQGFLVKAGDPGGFISFDYSNLIVNTERQRVKSKNKVGTRIDLYSNNFRDRMWIFSDDACTNEFDNGWDGRKLLADNRVSQIYALESDGNYQINAVKDINNRIIAFSAGEDTEFKLIFTHQNIQEKYASLFLIDLVENVAVDITANNSEYTFTGNSTYNINRFKIVTELSSVNPVKDASLSFHSINGKINVKNLTGKEVELNIYDLAGKIISVAKISSSIYSELQINLEKGIYTFNCKLDQKAYNSKLIVQ